MDRSNLLSFTTQVVVAACVIGGAAYIAVDMELVSAALAFLMSLVAFVLAYMVLRDVQTTATLKALDARFETFSEFEADMERRLAQKQNVVLTDVAATESSKNTQIASAMLAMLERMNKLEAAINNPAPSKIEPKVQKIEPQKISNDSPSANNTLTSPTGLHTIDLKKALRDDALSVHLQPVVGLSDRRPVNYEATMRLKLPAGNYLDATQFRKIAQKGGLLPILDRKLVHTSVRMLQTLKMLNKQAGLFTNISADLLDDAPAYREVRRFLEENKNLASSLVLEISQRDFRHLKPLAKARLDKLVGLGFRFSLDEVMDLRLDIAVLNQSGFRYVKIPAGILLHANVDDDAPALPKELATALAEANMTLAAIDVERENEVDALKGFQVRYAQGQLFAPPRPIKPELLNGAAQAPAPLKAATG